MLRKFCIINTCGREDCGDHQEQPDGFFYAVQDVDARIAELEKALRFYAEAQDFYLTDKNGNYVDSANDMARTTLALMET